MACRNPEVQQVIHRLPAGSALQRGCSCVVRRHGFLADKPILRITAPLREAQLVESRGMNLPHDETVVASKAARCVIAASGKALADFGPPRAYGAAATLLSARASYVGGFCGTATVLAGFRYGIPIYVPSYKLMPMRCRPSRTSPARTLAAPRC